MKLFFTFIIFINVTLFSQSFDSVKMDSLFSLIESNQKGMGSFSIFQNDNEVYHKSFGYGSVEDNLKATEKTKYRIGSISKTFTATIIMQFVDENKLTLETTLDKFFPELPNSKTITIEQLLRHRSGLHNFTDDDDYETYKERPKSRKEMIDIFIKKGSDFEPDKKHQYSNTNYVILSYIIEILENKSFGTVLQDRIVNPLKLENTYLGKKINPANNEAKSYTKTTKWRLSKETDMSIPIGAGAIVSTPTDLNIFIFNLFSGKLVSKKSLETMTTLVDNYGMGLIQFPFDELKGFGHTGGIDAFQSMVGYFPDKNVSFAYCSNGVSMSRNDILIGALNIYTGKDFQFPEFKDAIFLSDEELDKYLGTYGAVNFPLKITISKFGNNLTAQATGQPQIQLEAYDVDKFRFEAMGIKLEFKPSENIMILKQGGKEFTLVRR